MKSPKVIYLSSDDEPIFYRNQRLIQEHRIREEQRDTIDHFARIIEEVKEGKRKFVRVAALPEASSVPGAIPIDPSFSVFVAYKPSDLRFNIMSQHSETNSLSRAPVVTKSKPFKFEALQYKSTVTNIDQLSATLSKHNLRISIDLVVRDPCPDEGSCHAPRGSYKLQLTS